MLAGDESFDLREHWILDPAVTHLNHGSFGACPRVVLEHQRLFQERMERNPMRFFTRELERLSDEVRDRLASFLCANSDDLAFVPNATAGVNAVLRSLEWSRGDELVVTDHAYNACRNALDYVAERTGARVVVAQIPFPLASAEQVTRGILGVVTERTKLALIDHVTSPTALVFPIQAIVGALAERGVDTLVDGAHAPGMLDLDLRELGAAYYTGNCHKWICAPKGSAFLFVREDKQHAIRPTSISHGANSPRKGRSRFRVEFDWVGTDDPSAFLSIGAALSFLESIWPGGHSALMSRNRSLALRGQRFLADRLGEAVCAPPDMMGSIASVPLSRLPPGDPKELDPLQELLASRHAIEVPVFAWGGRRWIRISAQAYNRWADVQRLSSALSEELIRPA